MSEKKSEDTQLKVWEVFIQKKSGLPFEHCGNVHAGDKEMALQYARDVYSRRSEGRSIWVVPSEAIVATVPEDAPSFFDPADDKAYRHPSFYKTPDGVKL